MTNDAAMVDKMVPPRKPSTNIHMGAGSFLAGSVGGVEALAYVAYGVAPKRVSVSFTPRGSCAPEMRAGETNEYPPGGSPDFRHVFADLSRQNEAYRTNGPKCPGE